MRCALDESALETAWVVCMGEDGSVSVPSFRSQELVFRRSSCCPFTSTTPGPATTTTDARQSRLPVARVHLTSTQENSVPQETLLLPQSHSERSMNILRCSSPAAEQHSPAGSAGSSMTASSFRICSWDMRDGCVLDPLAAAARVATASLPTAAVECTTRNAKHIIERHE